jgi:hypothetical protein
MIKLIKNSGNNNISKILSLNFKNIFIYFIIQFKNINMYLFIIIVVNYKNKASFVLNNLS